MITKKKIDIEMFAYTIEVNIFDRWDEVSKEYSLVGDKDDERCGFVLYRSGISKVFINSKYDSAIIHESEHIKNRIFKDIGYTPMVNNDEIDAYLIQYIHSKILDVYYKHKQM